MVWSFDDPSETVEATSEAKFKASKSNLKFKSEVSNKKLVEKERVSRIISSRKDVQLVLVQNANDCRTSEVTPSKI